jgi:menaquinone-dependent protoporphyrinogen IX oxidase
VAAVKPTVLFVYFSYTQQTLKVAEVMAEVLRERGCEVSHARIEFTDPRYVSMFSAFPLRRAFLQLISMLPAQLRRATGQIRVPGAALEGAYDLICIGSPTWWLTTNMPVRSFLKSDTAGHLLKGKRFAAFVVCRRYWRNNLDTVKALGTSLGGEFVGGTHFTFAGGQIGSLLSFVSYMGSGENRPRYLGMKIPPTNLKPDYPEGALAFANRLADLVLHPLPVPPRNDIFHEREH